MDLQIQNLKSTTFFGQRLNRKTLALMKEFVDLFPNDSRRELAHTICDNLNWKTPTGAYRDQFCLRILEALERAGIVTLPAKRGTVSGFRRPIDRTAAGTPKAPIIADLHEIQPISVTVTTGSDLKALQECVDRYHPLGFKASLGCHLSYFIRDIAGRRLGVLMFESVSNLPPRDTWIGWSKTQREAGYGRLIRNNRFLIFPWVRVDNLASHALTLVGHHIRSDWHRRWGVTPLLMETFVDHQVHTGASYRAAGWTHIGTTASGKKDIYVLELISNARAQLCDIETTETAARCTNHGIGGRFLGISYGCGPDHRRSA